MQLIKRYKIPLLAAAVFVVCGFVFFLFWKLDVEAARTKSVSAYLNQTNDGALAAGVVEQTFLCGTPFHALGLLSATPGAPPPAGVLRAEVYDDGGRLLGAAEGASQHTTEGQYFVLHFAEPLYSERGVYRLVFSADMQEAGAVFSLAKSNASPAGWALAAEAGTPESGALCLLAATDPIGRFLTVFYWLFALAASGTAAALFVLAQSGRLPLHRLFVAAAGMLGLLYCVILPPYAAPDEQFHINQTFNISSRALGAAPADIPWGTTYRRAGDTNARIEDQNTTVFTYREIARGLGAASIDETPTAFAGAEVGGYRLLYWPAALAVTLCRLLHLGFVPTLFAGRLVNLALVVWLLALAVKLAPFGKSIFAAVGLLPMTLHLAASFSRDALTIALYVFFTALCLHYTLDKQIIGTFDLLLLFFLSFIAAPSKGVYIPVLLLCFLLPREKLRWRGRALPPAAARLFPWGILGVGAVSFLVQAGYAAIRENLGTLAAPAAALLPPVLCAAGLWYTAGLGTAGPAAALAADGVTFTFADLLARPAAILMLLARTFTQNAGFYLSSMLGGSLSYYSLPLDPLFTVLLVVLLFVACLPEKEERQLGKKPRAFCAVLVLAACALVVVGCLVWTPTYYDTIYGIQGRYFLPVLPLALCLLPGLPAGISKTRPLARPLVFCFSMVSLFALLNAFLLVLER